MGGLQVLKEFKDFIDKGDIVIIAVGLILSSCS